MSAMKVIDIEKADIAAGLRNVADEIEKAGFIAVAFAMLNQDGDAVFSCAVGPGACPDLVDAMVHDIKTALFASLEEME